MRLNNINHLYNTVLNCLEMKINGITVCDQQSMSPIIFGEKRLKYNFNGFTPVHRGEMRFEPICNFKQTQQLFAIFLQFMAEEDGMYVQIYYDQKCEDGLHSIVEMKTNTGLIRSNPYYNVNLCYLELILKLSGMPVDDLTNFDVAPMPEGEEPKRKRTPKFPVKDLF